MGTTGAARLGLSAFDQGIFEVASGLGFGDGVCGRSTVEI